MATLYSHSTAWTRIHNVEKVYMLNVRKMLAKMLAILGDAGYGEHITPKLATSAHECIEAHSMAVLQCDQPGVT